MSKSKSRNKSSKLKNEPLSDWDKNTSKLFEPDPKKGGLIKKLVTPGQNPYEYVPKGSSLWKKIFGK